MMHIKEDFILFYGIFFVFLLEKASAENYFEMAGKRVNNWQTTAPELEKTQHQVVDESAKNDIKSVVYTVLVSLLVCLVLLMCTVSIRFYFRRVRRNKTRSRKVVYQAKVRPKLSDSSKLLPEVDEQLNEKAEVYHYQQAKKNIKDFLRKNPPPPPFAKPIRPQGDATPLLLTEAETSDGDDISVYGYPGFAAAIEENSEVCNPLFNDISEYQREKISITPQAQVIRLYGQTDMTAYGSINRTISNSFTH